MFKILVSFLKSTGEIVPPVVTSNVPIQLTDIMPNCSDLIGYINIPDNTELLKNIFSYCIDIKTNKIIKLDREEDKYEY